MDTLSQLVCYFGGLYIASSLLCCVSRGRIKHIHEKIAPGALIAALAIFVGRYLSEWLAPVLAIIIAVVVSFIVCTLFRYYIEVPLIKRCFRKKVRQPKNDVEVNKT